MFESLCAVRRWRISGGCCACPMMRTAGNATTALLQKTMCDHRV